MQKHITFFMTTLMFIFSYSCNLSQNDIDNETDDEEDVVEVDYSPSNLFGKTVKIDTESRYYNFLSNGNCQISKPNIVNLFGTPTYSYSRINATTAKFHIQYVDKRTETSSYRNSVNTYTYYKTTTLDYTLHFTSNSEGRYSGTMTIHRTGYHIGSIYVAPKTSYYSPSGKFSLF